MLKRLRFYTALYSQYLSLSRPAFREFEPTFPSHLPSRLRIHFWTPVENSGARVTVHDMLPCLRDVVQQAGLPWQIGAGAELPTEKVDWLVCFKAVPDRDLVGLPRRVLLICDQAESYWDDLPGFDSVVATSSRPFAALVAGRNPDTTFISESEPAEHLEMGAKNLASPWSREPVLFWHGGPYSQDSLLALRPVLEKFAADREVVLHIVSGTSNASEESWGTLRVLRFPWSIEQSQSSARVARLGFIPARRSVRKSWLKPASRVRFLYALGVPTIGDARVPDVMDFMSRFDGPTAGSDSEWLDRLHECWASDHLDDLARAGHATVRGHYTTEHTALQWLHFFAREGMP